MERPLQITYRFLISFLLFNLFFATEEDDKEGGEEMSEFIFFDYTYYQREPGVLGRKQGNIIDKGVLIRKDEDEKFYYDKNNN